MTAPLRILVSNDDGIAAEGIIVLERIAKTLSDDVWVVAPELEQSGASHSLTLHIPVRVRKRDERHFAISGTPTDCVLLALKQIIPNATSPSPFQGEGRGEGNLQAAQNPHPPTPTGFGGRSPNLLPEREKGKKIDLLLSGINRGSNAADDITYSGTVAAAMEGTILEVPSIALSQLSDDSDNIHWETTEQFAPDLIRKLLAQGWPKTTLINLNFPNCTPGEVKGIRVCPQGKRRVSINHLERIDPKGRPYYWLGGERDNTAEKAGTDVDLLHQGYITVTPISMDLTDRETMEKLSAVF